jgi:hypothetical protein
MLQWRTVASSPLVLTPHELAQRLALGDPFYQEILQRGKVLYAGDRITEQVRC